MNRRAATLPGGQSGVAIVELALLLPFMAALFFGFVEVGRALYQQNMLSKAMVSGARYIARVPEGVAPDCSQGADWAAATGQARELISFPRGTAGGLLLPGLDSADALRFTVRAENSGGFVMCVIRAEASVPFVSIAGGPLPLLNLSAVGLNAATEERFIGE